MLHKGTMKALKQATALIEYEKELLENAESY